MTILGQHLHQSMAARELVCTRIGPHVGLLRRWGLDDSPAGVRGFSLRTIGALYNHAAVFKPRSVSYERHGAVGVAALEETLRACRDVGVLVITDIKRGDTDSTMDGYTDAYLSDSPGADVSTISPYLGPGSFEVTAHRAADLGDGLFVLALTSDPEGTQIQHTSSSSVVGRVVEMVAAWSEEIAPGSFGLAVGATIGDGIYRFGIGPPSFPGVFFAPGIGAQDVGTDEFRQVFGSGVTRVLVSISRSILTGGPIAAGLCEGFAHTLNAVGSALEQSESR